MKTTHFCEKCNYSTILKQNFNRHLVSEKHTSPTTINDNCIECKVCHKKYNSRSGLWNHNQKCKEVMVEKPNTIITIDIYIFFYKFYIYIYNHLLYQYRLYVFLFGDVYYNQTHY